MREVTVLSPHRDDAVFSLANALRSWCASGVQVHVANFFTYSVYAPRATAADRTASSLSALRKREDRLAFRSLHRAIEIQDWSLLDAPLRLHRATADVMGPNAAAVRSEDVAAVTRLLRPGYILAPLGVGDHVDHRTVRDAAMEAIPSHRLAFYEDLPYATWTPEEQVRQRVSEMASRLRRSYRLSTVRSHGHRRNKRRLAALYGTQIAPEEATPIAARLERIWVPAHSQPWITLVAAISS